MILEGKKRKNDFSWFFSSFLARQLPAGVPRVPWWLVPKSFGTLSSGPDSSGDISALRRSWKVFLGSKLASVSSTTRKTKQFVVLATPEKVIPMCPKNHHSAKIIVITASISVTELCSTCSKTTNHHGTRDRKVCQIVKEMFQMFNGLHTIGDLRKQFRSCTHLLKHQSSHIILPAIFGRNSFPQIEKITNQFLITLVGWGK